MSSDPAVCKDCKGPMKPLFTGFYCPNDCDRPKAALTINATTASNTPAGTINYANIKKTTAKHPAFIWFVPPTAPATPAPLRTFADDDCRDFYCGAKGTRVLQSGTIQPDGSTKWDDHYECTRCKKTWHVPSKP